MNINYNHFSFRITFLWVLIFFCFANVSAAQKISRIVGGKTANTNAWPWMTALVDSNNDVFCGSSLIAKDWVLTAAHCVYNTAPTSFNVIVNRADLNSNSGDELSVEKIIIHPLYNDSTLDNDLALIKLTSPSQYPPIKLLEPYSFQDDDEKSALALGWGNVSATEDIFPDELQQVELSIIGNISCSTVMDGITDDVLCAGDKNYEKDTCQGDSGGPLIIFDTESNSWRQAGITSWGVGSFEKNCAAPDRYGVYTRIENYAQFISDTICSASEKPETVNLELGINGQLVSTHWSTIDDTIGYRLNYAPFPHAETIYSIDMNKLTAFSVELSPGSAFFVAITSYKDNCLSGFSNIEHFIIE